VAPPFLTSASTLLLLHSSWHLTASTPLAGTLLPLSAELGLFPSPTYSLRQLPPLLGSGATTPPLQVASAGAAATCLSRPAVTGEARPYWMGPGLAG
jgi:hypothetical protein